MQFTCRGHTHRGKKAYLTNPLTRWTHRERMRPSKQQTTCCVHAKPEGGIHPNPGTHVLCHGAIEGAVHPSNPRIPRVVNATYTRSGHIEVIHPPHPCVTASIQATHAVRVHREMSHTHMHAHVRSTWSRRWSRRCRSARRSSR